MEDLIKALQIFLKYVEKDSYQEKYPFHCEHDELYVSVDPESVSYEDKEQLVELGFDDVGEGYFVSSRFGSN